MCASFGDEEGLSHSRSAGDVGVNGVQAAGEWVVRVGHGQCCAQALRLERGPGKARLSG